MNLADLIRRTKGDRTYEQLSAATRGALTAQRLQQIAAGARGSNFPKPATITALARALYVTERTVVLAAAETAGLNVSSASDDVAAILPDAAAGLTDRQVATILQLVRVMNDRPSREEGEGRGDAAAKTPAGGSPANNVQPLMRPDQGTDPAPPLDAAARNLGEPSRGQLQREQQDAEAEAPDEDPDEG